MFRQVALAAVLVTSAAGCSSSGKARPTPTLSPSDANKVYLAVVRPLFPDGNTDAGLIKFGHTVCNLFDNGVGWSRAIEAIQAVGPERAGEVATAAVTAYCPGHLQELPGGRDYDGP